jgi:hypothetical protein
LLQQGAARTRSKRASHQSSHLCGKLFDETGDRLTPSHSRTRAGKRLSYYVSHRLIAKSGEEHQAGWRLPAPKLEAQLARLISNTHSDPAAASRLVPDASANMMERICAKLDSWLKEVRQPEILKLADRIMLKPGSLQIRLDGEKISATLAIKTDAISEDALTIKSAFQMRKRGVETKLVLADVKTGQDETLIRNIAKAYHWFRQLTSGNTFDEIAVSEGTSKRRVQQMMDLAFLAPDIVREVLDGKQPTGFTSDWCKRHNLPMDWNAQRQLIASL